MLLIFKLEVPHQVTGREQLDLCSRRMKALPVLGRGRGLIMFLAIVNIGLLNTSGAIQIQGHGNTVSPLKASPACGEDRHIYNYTTS